MSNTFLTPGQLAERWGLSLRALESRRTKGQPPKFVRLAPGPRARVRYRLADIEAFEAANTTKELSHADSDS